MYHMFSSHSSFVMCFTVVLVQIKEISEKNRKKDNASLAISAGLDNQLVGDQMTCILLIRVCGGIRQKSRAVIVLML
jgi:hypothetical protein